METKSKDTLKYSKRNWHKGKLYFKEYKEIEYSEGKFSFEVMFYISDRHIVFRCYNKSVIEKLKRSYPLEKINVWFSLESNSYNEKWYTNAILKHIEIPRIIKLEKEKKQYQNGDSMKSMFGNEDF